MWPSCQLSGWLQPVATKKEFQKKKIKKNNSCFAVFIVFTRCFFAFWWKINKKPCKYNENSKTAVILFFLFFFWNSFFVATGWSQPDSWQLGHIRLAWPRSASNSTARRSRRDVSCKLILKIFQMSLDMDDVLEDIFKYHWTSLDIEDPLNDTLKDILNDIFKYVSALSNIE